MSINDLSIFGFAKIFCYRVFTDKNFKKKLKNELLQKSRVASSIQCFTVYNQWKQSNKL